MTDTDYELLSRYLDRELPAPAVTDLERRLADEPELEAALAQLRMLNNAITTTFRAPGTDSVPPRIAAMLAPTSKHVRPYARRSRTLGVGMAIAASVIAASGLWLASSGQMADNRTEPSLDQFALSELLEQSPSRAAGWEPLADGSRARAVLSFAARDGSWCREYLVASAKGDQWHGVACRQQGAWDTRVVSAVNAGVENQGSEYRPAGADDSNEVAAFIGNNAADIALSREEEAGLIANRWQ